MALNLSNFEAKALEATQSFWGNRQKAMQKQIESGIADQGERAGVTAGKEQLYTTASVITSTRKAETTGIYTDLSEMTSLKTFIASLAGHIAAEVALF